MWRLVVISLFVATASAASCNLYFNTRQPGIFTRKFGSNRLVLPTQGSYLTIDDNVEVTAYCTEGFRGYSSYQSTPLSEIIFSCSSSGSVVYRMANSTSTSAATSGGQLACPSMSTYYEATIASCPFYGLAYGFFIGKTSVIFADTCYDLNTMQSRFSHYVAGVRTSVVEAQAALNPLNVSSSAPDVNFGIADVSTQQSILNAAVKVAIPNYAAIVNYVMKGLIPLDSSVGIFSDFTGSFDNTNLIAWWTPLKSGNWKLVEDAITKVSINQPYDVYVGTSSVLNYPVGGNCQITDQLTYKVNQYTRTVPLYVWNYVKPLNNSTDDGVVIIGVNSPFFVSGDKSLILCSDICDTISWLDTVNSVRKIPSLGYVYCCKPSDVKGKLDNFPSFA